MKDEDTKKICEVMERIDAEIMFVAEELGVAKAIIGALHASMDVALRCAPTPINGISLITYVLHHVIEECDECTCEEEEED